MSVYWSRICLREDVGAKVSSLISHQQKNVRFLTMSLRRLSNTSANGCLQWKVCPLGIHNPFFLKAWPGVLKLLIVQVFGAHLSALFIRKCVRCDLKTGFLPHCSIPSETPLFEDLRWCVKGYGSHLLFAWTLLSCLLSARRMNWEGHKCL